MRVMLQHLPRYVASNCHDGRVASGAYLDPVELLSLTRAKASIEARPSTRHYTRE
jgi:hypothetical protein